jgi:hypothetical protein
VGWDKLGRREETEELSVETSVINKNNKLVHDKNGEVLKKKV